MLSFFSKKKHSPPDTPPEEAIPGPEPAQEHNGDDFIFVERKPGNPQNPQTTGPMYPPMPQAPYGLPYPMSPYQRGAASGPNPTVGESTPVPYIQGVPFELAPQLSTTNSLDLVQLQVDGILAVMTRQMSVDENEAYNFALERSVKNESEAY